MIINIALLREKVNAYKQVLENTLNYRKEWKDKTRQMIKNTLQTISEQTGLKASVTEKNNIENLEAVILDLGRSSSGIAESFENTEVKRLMVKSNGSLIYQQLFNGKIMVMMAGPHIEGYGEPKSPKSLQIIRPDEVTEQIIFRHVKDLLDDITEWEDYDDEDPKTKVPFQPIGFRHTVQLAEGNGNKGENSDRSKQ